jgi:hypothetical protein
MGLQELYWRALCGSWQSILVYWWQLQNKLELSSVWDVRQVFWIECIEVINSSWKLNGSFPHIEISLRYRIIKSSAEVTLREERNAFTLFINENRSNCISTGILNLSLHISFVWFRSPFLFYLLVQSRCRGFLFSLDHTQTHTTVGRTPQTSTWQRTHKRQTSMPPLRFEPTIPASTPPQTHALDRAAPGFGLHVSLSAKKKTPLLTHRGMNYLSNKPTFERHRLIYNLTRFH